MRTYVCIKSREIILDRMKEFSEQKGLFGLWGKSGSGKTALLEEFARRDFAFRFNVLEDAKDLKTLLNSILSEQKKTLILLDEVGMYDESLLESVRIYSDNFPFVLSSHKKLKVFNKEHFKSRFVAEFSLENLSLNELEDYVKTKHKVFLEKKALKFLKQIYKGNLRNIDKTLKSFKELKDFYKGSKSCIYMLKLSALDNALLG